MNKATFPPLLYPSVISASLILFWTDLTRQQVEEDLKKIFEDLVDKPEGRNPDFFYVSLCRSNIFERRVMHATILAPQVEVAGEC